MGCCVAIGMTKVVIPKKNVRKCLAAINDLHSDSNLQSNATGGTFGFDSAKLPVLREQYRYAWVENPLSSRGFPTLVSAFAAWRYEAVAEQKDRSVEVVYFSGGKWGDDEILYTAIAPFVKCGGRIDVRGEDDELWAYDFREGKLVHLIGQVVYTETNKDR